MIYDMWVTPNYATDYVASSTNYYDSYLHSYSFSDTSKMIDEIEDIKEEEFENLLGLTK